MGFKIYSFKDTFGYTKNFNLKLSQNSFLFYTKEIFGSKYFFSGTKLGYKKNKMLSISSW